MPDRTLDALWDRIEIDELMLRFGRAVDLHDWPMYRSTFLDRFEPAAPVPFYGPLRRAARDRRGRAWLLSDHAPFVNGAAIAVDGGYLSI